MTAAISHQMRTPGGVNMSFTLAVLMIALLPDVWVDDRSGDHDAVDPPGDDL